MGKTLLIIFLLKMSHCFAQSGNFMIYNLYRNKCMGDSLRVLFNCDPNNVKHWYRWTSENRIFNIAQKKCLGVDSKTKFGKLKWQECNSQSDLQKWECRENSSFALKNESLYLSIQKKTFQLALSNNPGPLDKWTIKGKVDDICSQPYEGNFMIYNLYRNKCMGDSLRVLFNCDPNNVKHWYRWTSENRIFNIAQKKCLGVDSKTKFGKLKWQECNSQSDLQKWECRENSSFALKNESLYLSIQKKTFQLALSNNPGPLDKWTIKGKVDDICSQPYEELYTINGNGLGRPCHFPFLYKNIWYADCTMVDSPVNNPWCATKPDYDTSQTWGYCPTLTGDTFWMKNPLNGVAYQVNENSALTWYQARKSCQQQWGDLASITEPHEQAFISGLAQKTVQQLWTGLNNLDASSGWHWVNGQPLRYLKWLSGQPSAQPEHHCGTLSPHIHLSQWATAVCSDNHGYVCQRGISTPTVPPVVAMGPCPSPWIPYSGYCYFLNRAGKTWLEARDACHKEGGDLLSVLSIEEHGFIISQLGYLKTDMLWIGFNDLKTSMLFEWSDHSSVPFVSWEVDEPSSNVELKTDCVLMRGEEGKWAVQVCQNKYGYICKRNANTYPSSNDTVITNPGCKAGWIRHGYYCYLAGTETKTFEEAEQTCQKTGSHLVDVTNRVENAFLISLVGARPEKHFWIGLSNQKVRHFFQWTSGSKVLYTHFNAEMPGQKQGCVAMTTGVFAGLWDVLHCTNKEKYICKQMAEGLITTQAPSTTPALNCTQDWQPIEHNNLCYKFFYVREGERKTWFEARDFCREVGGDLLSIHSGSDLLQENLLYGTNVWIGYSIQDPSEGYVWSDGSSSSYENWEEGEPNNYNNMEGCASLTLKRKWWLGKGHEWNDLNCEDRLPWLCEIQKEVTPKEVQITAQTYNMTDDGWIIFRDSQYYFKGYYSHMEEARGFCKRHHGDLVVINDEVERVFLWHQMKFVMSYDAYIGMTIDLDKSFMWMDGSPVVFQAWEKNHPAFVNFEERCVKMTQGQGVWESVNCGETLRYICKRRGSVPANSTVAPTEPSPGGCAPDWLMFQKKCYKKEMDPKTWLEARSHCRTLGGDLAAVTNKQQQAFLTFNMAEHSQNMWTGLNKLGSQMFRWTDGSHTQFTNWASGEPYGYWNSLNSRDCVVISDGEGSQPGKWMTKDCNDTNNYICSRAIDHLIIPSPTEEANTSVKLGNSSYMVVQSNQTWQNAKKHCELQGGHLASIRDIFSQSYVELQTYRLQQPLWIGLNSLMYHGYFLWTDNWHLNMERWAPGEPKTEHPCVYVDIQGQWKTAYCNQTYYSVCKNSTDIATTPPTQYPGKCPEQTVESSVPWIPFRRHCYEFVPLESNWALAFKYCANTGADLVSIEDNAESQFVEHYLNVLGNNERNFWLGLYKTHAGRWEWLDKTVVDYTNWQTVPSFHEYEDLNYDFEEINNCALIFRETKQWVKVPCEATNAAVICKTEKLITPTVETLPHRDETESSHVHVAVTVVVVIAVLCLLIGLSYYCYRKVSRVQIAATSFGNSLYFHREETQHEENDDRNLLKNVEMSE